MTGPRNVPDDLAATPSRPMGEFGLIEWIRARSSASGARVALGIGDDCALLRFERGVELLATTDMLMDGRHFQLDRDGPEAVGSKAMAVNISDIAAMAGEPRAALVAVALPREQAVTIAQRLHQGMIQVAERFGVVLAGGDTNAWNGPLVICVTLLGEATALGPVRRSGARPGDVIVVTGPLGGSVLGRHLRPEPRVAEALALHRAAGKGLHALIDISDGLASDLRHIVDESGGLGALLDAKTLPIHPDATILSAQDGREPIDHALFDGEDFELCAVLAPEDARRLLDRPPEGVRLVPVGTITAESGLRIQKDRGVIEPLEPGGFDHLTSP